jgi:uncharacterized protein (DUF427 family)
VKPVEDVWDYPRPPRIDASGEHVVIDLGGVTIVDTHRPLRVLETASPPTYYLPVEDVAEGVMTPSTGGHSSFCEWKGRASYYDVAAGERTARNGAWWYPSPTPAFRDIADHVAFYPGRMDACYVDGEVVRPQDGDFYGGWITSRITGRMKGGPGTGHW